MSEPGDLSWLVAAPALSGKAAIVAAAAEEFGMPVEGPAPVQVWRAAGPLPGGADRTYGRRWGHLVAALECGAEIPPWAVLDTGAGTERIELAAPMDGDTVRALAGSYVEVLLVNDAAVSMTVIRRRP